MSKASQLLQILGEIYSPEEAARYWRKETPDKPREERASLRQNLQWGRSDAGERASAWRESQQRQKTNK